MSISVCVSKSSKSFCIISVCVSKSLKSFCIISVCVSKSYLIPLFFNFFIMGTGF